jgi:hypothetical protein
MLLMTEPVSNLWDNDDPDDGDRQSDGRDCNRPVIILHFSSAKPSSAAVLWPRLRIGFAGSFWRSGRYSRT